MIYRLIAAGHLARHALAEPLAANGLKPGDDAILLFMAARPKGVSTKKLASANGLEESALVSRLGRLVTSDLIEPTITHTKSLPGYSLTEQGVTVCEELMDHWERLEGALIGELKPKNRKELKKVLNRFVMLLGLE